MKRRRERRARASSMASKKRQKEDPLNPQVVDVFETFMGDGSLNAEGKSQ